ncbi:hypothetical protein KCTCHS21_56050 [Cohnella abietis]|uniref:Uncharacterized protein n=1 Tax=Cohnella abietis TaxID=2507935 RepID=A0A3T1DDH4_9BACL|nr:hypothetical protein KCTCHS21_56050 [Cohnella abietis]
MPSMHYSYQPMLSKYARVRKGRTIEHTFGIMGLWIRYGGSERGK